MYNYRYHLVTIISIFAALVIGLLLGVALTGSDLVRDASSNLAKSLTEQFDELHERNQTLFAQLEKEKLFSAQLSAGWEKERLKGRTIALLTRTPKDEDALTDELSRIITQCGGIPVVLRINETEGFGLEDEKFVNELKKILPGKPDEDYTVTLARALAEEWSYTYSKNGDHTANGSASSGTMIEQGLSGAASLAAAFDDNYPLTRKLIETGHLEVAVFYRPLLDGTYFAELTEPNISLDQLAAYQHAQNQGLPYGINGIIDMAVYTKANSTQTQVDMVAVQIAREFEILGLTGKLPYLFPQKDNSSSTAKGDSKTGNSNPNENLSYFALLIQEGDHAEAMMAVASDRKLSCVLTIHPEYRRYSVVALLTGATKGTYGFDRSGIQPFPQIPFDVEGNFPFTQ